MEISGWHWTESQSFLLHNAYLGRGYVPAASLMAAASGNPGFVSRYQVLNREQKKEDAWEMVRKAIAPNCPSRHGAFFMFEDMETANHARQRWFSHEDRIAIRAVVSLARASVHRADAEWLNCPEGEWEDAAKCYWQSVASRLNELLPWNWKPKASAMVAAAA